MLNVVIAQILLVLVIGLWLGAKFKDSPMIKFFGRNDWFTGSFLILVGYMNYVVYASDYIRNLNLILITLGFVLILFSVLDLVKK